MTAFPSDRTCQFGQHTEVKCFRRSLVITSSTAASKDLQGVGRPKRQATRLQAVKEKAGETLETAKPAEQSRKLPNIFKRAVQALRPEPEDTEHVCHSCYFEERSCSFCHIGCIFATLHILFSPTCPSPCKGKAC